jgi:hypothetical protein
MSVIPKDVENKVTELGFDILGVVPLYKRWSVIGIKNGKRYNIKLNESDMSVCSIHLLRYKYNQWGSRVLDVERVLVQSEKAEKIRVI